jgi:uncharacterized Rmd1/YagE family protein
MNNTAVTTLSARAVLVAGRLDLKAMEKSNLLDVDPLVIPAGVDGRAVLFRFGVVVLIGLEPAEQVAFLNNIESVMVDPREDPVEETLELVVEDENADRVRPDGRFALVDDTVERLQCVADVLAASVVLADYERRVADGFGLVEPMAEALKRNGRRLKSRDLLSYIGSTLLMQQTMVGRVEVGEKPEVLWERPDLERLYERLKDEFEVDERHRALERKLALISRTAETGLDLIHTKRSLRVEWYIVILIVVEIVLLVWDMFLK